MKNYNFLENLKKYLRKIVDTETTHIEYAKWHLEKVEDFESEILQLLAQLEKYKQNNQILFDFIIENDLESKFWNHREKQLTDKEKVYD